MTESRKRRASTELQYETKIVDLPEEILVGIFKHLDKSDLLALTLQNKQFNRIISNDFMDDLKLYITPQKLQTAWIGSRKYKIVEFRSKCADGELMIFLNILQSIGSDIKKLLMANITVKLSTLKDILKMCKNLKFLDLPGIEGDASEFLANLPSLDLDELVCGRNIGRALQLLICSNTKSVKFYVVIASDKDFIQNFLKVQKNLEVLELNLCEGSVAFFDTNALNDVDFRLKTLIVVGDLDIPNTENFSAFINNHADTLTHVELPYLLRADGLNCIKCVKKIKKLILQAYSLENFDILENVDELECWYAGNFDLAVKFPNLMKLKIEDHENCLKLGSFAKLTHLDIVDSHAIEDLTISSSTKVIRFSIYTFAAMPNFEHFQFDEIELKNCKNVDWLAEFLAKDETRVEKLTFRCMEISSEVLKAMMKHGYKVTNFDSENVMFL